MTKYEREQKALSWIERMEDEFPQEIENSILGAMVYNKYSRIPSPLERSGNVSFEVTDLTTEKAILKYTRISSVAALNFASYKYPGGGFVKGSIAQEEALCHASSLYPVLSSERFAPEYEYNRSHQNGGLYNNWAIFTPDIVFPSSGDWFDLADILTCPAPNYSAWKGQNQALYRQILVERIKFILDIFYTKKSKVVVLGAFGCGVFGNDPTQVAEIFRVLLEKYDYGFDRVVFAIPPGPNLDAFKKVFTQ